MVVGESKRPTNIMDGIENTGDVRLHDHRLRLKQRFDIVRKLGQGTYGKVQLGINKKTGQEVAIKTIKKCKIESEADLVRIRREVQIMSSVRHPNIVHIYEVFENSEKMILVMEYCPGGELYDYLSQKKVLQEDEAKRLFRQIATAVYYCHIHKICHRDLKLENVLLDDTGSAKIADFGLSNVFKETSLLSTFCGSPLYASPEIVKGTPYIGPEVDCWSLGVLLYTLVYGAMPFDGSNFKRLVRQISNGDYYEPKTPSTASPLIRDMLTVDPVKRADIVYICDHPWVNGGGSEPPCLELAEALAAQTPVRLDLLLSLAPRAAAADGVLVPQKADTTQEDESGTDLTNSASMAVEPSNSAEKRILELVAEGGEDAIKPSPTRTLVAGGDNKRKLELAMSASGLQRKKERVASCARMPSAEVLPEERAETPREGSPAAPVPAPSPPTTTPVQATTPVAEMEQPTLKSSATMIITPSPPPPEEIKVPTKEPTKEEPKSTGAKPRVTVKKKISPTKSVEEKVQDKPDDKKEESKVSAVSSAADKLTTLSITQPSSVPAKPKKFSVPGSSVGSFKEQFERRSSLTGPEIKRNVTKPVVSKIAKPKAQSEDRDVTTKAPDTGSVRLQQIGIEPSALPMEPLNRGGVKKTESEPSHSSAVDPAVLLQDARRSLQNSMAKLVEEKVGEEKKRAAARDIISSAIRTGKPPVPYGRSSSAGVTSLSSLSSLPSPSPAAAPPRLFRTEAQHTVEDHRNRGLSVERIIPISVAEEEPSPPPKEVSPAAPRIAPHKPAPLPIRRLVSSESGGSDACSSPSSGEAIKKSAREFIIPIAVEGKGFVTPRAGSLEPETASASRLTRLTKPRRISLVSGGESEEEDDGHMHRLRPSRTARAESVSSGEEDEEDEGFHLLTAENLFSTLLHRVRSLTNRLNGEEGPGFSKHSHSLFNNMQTPFFNSPRLSRRHNLIREGWGSRDFNADFESMFNNTRQPMPRGRTKKSNEHQTETQQKCEENGESASEAGDLDLSALKFSAREEAALAGLTPALARRLARSLLAHLPRLPPAAARHLRRTLSLHAGAAPARPAAARYERSHSATKYAPPDAADLLDYSPHDVTDDISLQESDLVTSDTSLLDKPPASTENSQQDHVASADGFRNDVDTISADNSLLDRSFASDEATDSMTLNSENVSAPKPLPEEISIKREKVLPKSKDIDLEIPIPQFSTLPRLKRYSSVAREMTPPAVPSAEMFDVAPRVTSPREFTYSRNSSAHSNPDRSLLGKYLLSPERTFAIDEPYTSDNGSLLSEPSYIAAYGNPGHGNTNMGFRRHSMRLSADQPRKRISRFLRPDFYDVPPDESLYAKHKKEKELETQKVLREIREKKIKSYDSYNSLNSSTDAPEVTMSQIDDKDISRKSLSPIGVLLTKERSRSTTPYSPHLDNIKENNIGTVDKTNKLTDSSHSNTEIVGERTSFRESKLLRPKSYPIKSLDDNNAKEVTTIEIKDNQDDDPTEKHKYKESKLIRPKSYPTSSPSPEKVYVSRNKKKEVENEPEKLADVEVSFSVSLPSKSKAKIQKANSIDTKEKNNQDANNKNDIGGVKSSKKLSEKGNKVEEKQANNSIVKPNNDEINYNILNHKMKKEEVILKPAESEPTEKKGTIKKKIIRKVSSKSKADAAGTQDGTTEKKKVIKKVKEKTTDDNKQLIAPKKKSVLQSIGQKFEKLTTKSVSPEKTIVNKVTKSDSNNMSHVDMKSIEKQPDLSISTNKALSNETTNNINTIGNATDVEEQQTQPNKTTVSKVLSLFKKDRSKQLLEKSISLEADKNGNKDDITQCDESNDKPRRPNSLMLNGVGKKKYGRAASDSISMSSAQNDESGVSTLKRDDSKRNSLRLDFSRLPRVKKIAPSNPSVEPQMSFTEKDANVEKNGVVSETNLSNGSYDSRSRSRSRSSFSNAEVNPEHIISLKVGDEHNENRETNSAQQRFREHEPTTPDREDVVDRIRRKSFYSRFNEKKAKRKSNLVGPGAVEYDPIARIYAKPNETSFDSSPVSPSYDLSPGYPEQELASPLDRYRSLLAEAPLSPRSSLKYDQYGLNDHKTNSYRSLDRRDFKKYSGSRSYLDYDPTMSYGAHRYNRTVSLLDSPDGDDHTLAHFRDPLKYNRTISMYSPGTYATYRPKKTRNSAIILKESEKEPSPENILDKIRQRKKANAAAKHDADSIARSSYSSKGEGNGAECSEKVD